MVVAQRLAAADRSESALQPAQIHRLVSTKKDNASTISNDLTALAVVEPL
jgi:hypothetical protein